MFSYIPVLESRVNSRLEKVRAMKLDFVKCIFKLSTIIRYQM